MKTVKTIELHRRSKAEAPVRSEAFLARSPLQAQRERTIAYQAALEILG